MNTIKLTCPDCGKSFDYEYRPDIVIGSRDKITKELYLDCPKEGCRETNKYIIEIEADNGK